MTLKLLEGRDIDSATRAILSHARDASRTLDVPFFVGGAMARDILLVHVFGQEARRATRDVDLGIYVSNWDEFSHFKDELFATGQFAIVAGKEHRLNYGPPPSTPLDLIPFGGVESPPPFIKWPPGHDVVLNVAGFEDALQSALDVDLGQGLTVKTCSLPSLAVLKLIAWKDRCMETNKDATDFLLIAEKYAEADNQERLYAEELPLLTGAGDVELAGAMLLGKDAVQQAHQDTAVAIKDILASPRLRQLFIDHLIRAKAAQATEQDEQRYGQIFDAFRDGFNA